MNQIGADFSQIQKLAEVMIDQRNVSVLHDWPGQPLGVTVYS
jgi:hypothetical protein